MKRFNYLLLILCLLATTSVASGSIEDALDHALLDHPAEIIGSKWREIPTKNSDRHIASLYHEFGLRPLWVTRDGPGKQATAILDALGAAADDGLDPEDYGISEIKSIWESRKEDDLARLDILLSTGLVEYINDVRHGRIQIRKQDDTVYYRMADRTSDPVAIIKEVLAANDVTSLLADQFPSHSLYRQTRAGLKRYRALARTAQPVSIPGGVSIHPGEPDARLPAIRQHLVLTGELDRDSGSDIYDDHTVEAIKRYQARHGLEVDGVIGKGTLTEMNIPFEQRVRQIKINLERLRWANHDLGEKYVMVNIPAFTAYTVSKDDIVFSMAVIVGKHYHETPVFSETIKYVVINPYWTIPPSIARKEMLPKLRKNPEYLKEKHISLFRGWSDDNEIDPQSIDWNKVSGMEMNQYRLRQKPGPWNALGVLKIVFPNEHSVYMHDTPEQNLFERNVKAFSHGCIRMNKAVKQAALVLADTEGNWSEEHINEVVKSAERTVVRLRDPVPVHILYQTAWGDKDGSVHFVRDIYGRDKRLEQVLYGK